MTHHYNMEKISVLYIASDASGGGSTASLMNLIISLRDEVDPIVLFPYEGEAVAIMRQNGIECHIIPYIVLYLYKKVPLAAAWPKIWLWSPIFVVINEIRCVYKVFSVLKGRKISIVHSNTSPTTIGCILSVVLFAKHIWHIREFLDLDFDFDIFGGIEKLKRRVRLADARIVISHAICEHWGFQSENTFVVNNAVRSSKECSFIMPKEKYILFVSNMLTERKGVLFAIEAFANSCLANKGFALYLVGNINDSDMARRIDDCIMSFGCQHAIRLFPFQKDIRTFFEHASAFLMASYFEGLGRVTAEAMFFGCPIVARASGGTMDLIINGETGLLFNTMAECSDKLVEICSLNKDEMINRAQKFAIDNLSEEVYGPKIIAIYKQLLSKQ